MILLLKMLHLLALAIGLGGGVANIVLGAMAGARAPEIVRPVQKRIGRLAFAALVVLWITGVWMVAQSYPLSALNVWFWLKMLAVLALTAAAVTAQVSILRPGPGTPARLKTLGLVLVAASALAVVLAVLSFG